MAWDGQTGSVEGHVDFAARTRAMRRAFVGSVRRGIRPHRTPGLTRGMADEAKPPPAGIAYSAFKLGVPKESIPGENRVATTPAVVAKYKKLGLEVAVEKGAGLRANIIDSEYVAAGATIEDRAAIFQKDMIFKVWVASTVPLWVVSQDPLPNPLGRHPSPHRRLVGGQNRAPGLEPPPRTRRRARFRPKSACDCFRNVARTLEFLCRPWGGFR
jgi:hypothetical protein